MPTLTLKTSREVHLLRSLLQRRIEELDKVADREPAGAAALHRRQAQELRDMLSRVHVEPAPPPEIN
jgi:hypothetical protein